MRTVSKALWLLSALIGTAATPRAADEPAAPAFSLSALGSLVYAKASNTDSGDLFGWSVAASGNTVVVGAPNEESNASGVNGDQSDNSANNTGAAYVFVYQEGVWSQQAYLKASNSQKDDNFGHSVAISGDTIVVGAHLEDSAATGVNGDGFNNSQSGSGAAYVFVRNGASWSQQAYLKASNTSGVTKPDQFGTTVAISGDTLVVGAPLEDSGATGVNGDQLNDDNFDSGAAYVFVRNGATWSQQAYLKASNTGSADTFGASLAISGDTIVVGAAGETSGEDSFGSGVSGDGLGNAITNSGAAYVFVREAGTWTQQAFLKAVNPLQGAAFGISAAISGDTIMIGAFREGSNATGIDGNPFNQSASNSGAVYEFVRSAGSWSVGSYIKASNTGAGDRFGTSVGLSGDTLVVGAYREDSDATGIDGDQASNALTDPGAAYVFTRDGAGWSQHAYLKATNTDERDEFGRVVAVSGDIVVVGAHQEDSLSVGINGSQVDLSNTQAGAAYLLDLDLQPEAWVDVGLGLAGLTGVPQLVGTGTLVGGEPVSIALSNARPLSSVALVIGLTRIDAPFKAGTLVPFPDVLILGLPTDASGALLISTQWPIGLPGDFQFWVQEWVTDAAGPSGFAASNGLAGTTP